MRQIFLVLALTIILGFTGCPPKAGKPTPTDTPASSENQAAKKPVAASQPSTPEADEAVDLVEKLNGKWILTPSGTVNSIIIDSSDLDEASFELFAKQVDLETLLIANFRELNDSMVEKLVSLKKLKNLQLKNSSISDAAIKTLAEAFPGLKSLDISSNTLLKDSALSEIAKLKDLEDLVMNYCNFSEFGILEITSLPKLKTLDIRANMQIGNGGLDYITQLPSLKSLKHRSLAAGDSGLESLTAVKGLDTLEIQDFNISDQAGQLIKKFNNLTNLIIFRCQGFGSTGLLELKGMKISRLSLRDLPSVDDTGMEVFRELTSLKRLYLEELTSVSDTGFLNLVYLKNLNTLDIRLIPITDKSLETISKLPNLKSLFLCSTQITDASADILLAMPKLENLTLKDNSKITPAALYKLSDSEKFKKIDFGSSTPKDE